MRIVSSTPHARSCCTALLGSNLRKERHVTQTINQTKHLKARDPGRHTGKPVWGRWVWCSGHSVGWCCARCPSGAVETGGTGSPLSACAHGELFFLNAHSQAQMRQREDPQLTPAGTTQQPALTKEAENTNEYILLISSALRIYIFFKDQGGFRKAKVHLYLTGSHYINGLFKYCVTILI